MRFQLVTDPVHIAHFSQAFQSLSGVNLPQDYYEGSRVMAAFDDKGGMIGGWVLRLKPPFRSFSLIPPHSTSIQAFMANRNEEDVAELNGVWVDARLTTTPGNDHDRRPGLRRLPHALENPALLFQAGTLACEAAFQSDQTIHSFRVRARMETPLHLSARILRDSLRYYGAFVHATLGHRPRNLLEGQMWCYRKIPAVWNMPCVVFKTFQGFLFSNAHTKKGLNRLASKMAFFALVIIFLWPILVPFLAFRRGLRPWLTNWVVGLNRPDLMLSVGRGPYEWSDSEQLASSLLHFIPGNMIFALSSHRDFDVDDKSKFPGLCAAHGIPCVPLVLIEDLADDTAYIIKPKNEGQGRGIRKVQGREAKTLADPTTHILQNVLTNHPEILSIVGPLAGLSTVRVLTLQPANGQFVVYGALLRMGRAHALVDNLSQGGIAVPLSAEGRLQKGASYHELKHLGPTAFPIEAHPDTGIVFTGLALPHFAEMNAMCLRAHRLLCPHMHFCAWDVALTPEGPRLVEAASYLGGAYEFLKSGDFKAYCSALALAMDHAEELYQNSKRRRSAHEVD